MAKNESARRSSRNKASATTDLAGIKKWAREWLDALVFAGVAALIIRTFLFEAYRIPTPSMENSLMTGDFLIVSKVHYGARTPMSIGIPFTGIHIKGLELPWWRLPAITDVKRNDIVVFNYPIDDLVIAQKANYIKRCVAIPGDTVSLAGGNLFLNRKPALENPEFRRFFRVQAKEGKRISAARFKKNGVELSGSLSPSDYLVTATAGQAEILKSWAEVNLVEPYVLPKEYNEFGRTNFTFARAFNTNHHQMAEFVVPFKGQTVTLTPENWPFYKDIVTRYEGNAVQVTSAGFIINGTPDSVYTLKMNYYFMMGDNRDNSEDSRFWGFVPEDHIVGKPAVIYFSFGTDPFRIRFDRLLDWLL